MRRVLFLILLIVVSVWLGYSFRLVGRGDSQKLPIIGQPKRPILKVALVADSENENDLLDRALRQAQGKGINFVIGLGDWSQVGTEKELGGVKAIFDSSKLPYYLTAGDHDLWDSRNRGEEALSNYKKVFGNPTQELQKDGIEFVIVDNSDIYKGISSGDWDFLSRSLAKCVRGPVGENSKLETRNEKFSGEDPKLCFVFAHKTPFHPESSHVMGEDSAQVAQQAQNFMSLLETQKVNGFFSGDLHFFAQYQSPSGSVKIMTVGAASSNRNFQGPRFAILTVYDDYSWKVEDVEIR